MFQPLYGFLHLSRSFCGCKITRMVSKQVLYNYTKCLNHVFINTEAPGFKTQEIIFLTTAHDENHFNLNIYFIWGFFEILRLFLFESLLI